MFEKIFGKKNSIQRGLVIGFILAIIIIEFFTFIGFQIFNNKEAYEGIIQVNLDTSDKVKELSQLVKRSIFIGGINIVVIGGIFMRLMSKKMLAPIQKLKEATKKVSAGDFSIRLETLREDEIGELTKNFNKMVSELGSIESLKKEFIDNVSHEIKTPISSIQGFAELLEDENLSNEERKEYLDIIKEESNRLLNLSTNILKLSKLQNQTRITNKEQINVSEQIRKSVSLLEPKWKEKEIVFNINMEEKYFDGDEDLLFQVWINLIENAIKFSKHEGKIDILLKQVENDILIKIKDNGIGMEEGELKKIFTRFYQIDKSHSEKGSGLGLAIVKRIIELSEGILEVESQKDKGTTIIVRLPIKDKNQVVIV